MGSFQTDLLVTVTVLAWMGRGEKENIDDAHHSNHKHIGLGSVTKVDSIEVRWPNGKTSRLDRPGINQYHEVGPK